MPDAPRITYRAPKLGHTQVRDWTRANGYPVSERGRTAPEITEAFFADHPEILEQADTFEMVRATARTPGASPEDYAWEKSSRLGEGQQCSPATIRYSCGAIFAIIPPLPPPEGQTVDLLDLRPYVFPQADLRCDRHQPPASPAQTAERSSSARERSAYRPLRNDHHSIFPNAADGIISHNSRTLEKTAQWAIEGAHGEPPHRYRRKKPDRVGRCNH
ncbi:Lsr2 family DNA-binding protein [Actinomadura sp. ATCC 39365]